MRRLALLLSTAGYVGYAPVAPGTWGSLVGVMLFLGLRSLQSATLELAIILMLFAVGVWSGTIAERHFGGNDPGPVVLDEVVGMLITLWAVPVGAGGLLVGFLLFRILDIVKPPPAAQLERLHGGWGVMADDAMAAVYGNLMLRGLLWLAPGWLA